MPRELSISVSPEIAMDSDMLRTYVASKLKVESASIRGIKTEKRSLDARRNPVKFHLKVQVFIKEDFQEINYKKKYPNVKGKKRVIVIGAGPAGLFSALRLIELGICPVVVERGKDVRGRRRDIVKIIREQKVNPNSNYCFGEGGAGTFSDGMST